MIKKNKFIDLNRYHLLDHIGSGSFGDVFKVREIKTNKIYSGKIIKKTISNDYMNNEESLLFFREVKLMSIFNHPSIIKFIGYSPIDFEQLPHPTIIAEFVSRGTLNDVIKLESSGLSPDGWNETKKLINIYGIACGM